MNKVKIKIISAFFLFTFTVLRLQSQGLDTYWTLVVAGKNITTPVFWNGNIYTAGEDRALNCITSQGKFLWRRNTKEFPGEFLSVSSSGLVYLVTAKGNLEVFSSQGFPAWQYKLDKKPIFPIHTARDGRCFIIQKDNIICLTPSGKLKWSLPLSSAPISPPSETGSKDIVLVLTSGDFLRISIFGTVVEQHRLKKTVSAVGEAPNGYILACTDKTVSYYKTAAGSEAAWQVTENGICKNAFYKNGKVLYLFENGKAVFKTLETGELIWELSLNGNFSDGVNCRAEGNEFNITAKGYGCTITDSGKIKWEKQINEKSFFPLITENGLLIGITKEFLNAYRVETKLLRRGAGGNVTESFYSIIDEKEKSAAEELPFFIEYSTVGELLEVITYEIKKGSVGEKEPRYAFQLKTILQNKRKASYFAQGFTSFDRANAAELLGKLGSYEYRNILLGEINLSNDSTVDAGVLRGLAYLAYDPDGKTIEGIDFLIQKASYEDSERMKAACDCLTALTKTGNRETAKSAIALLFSVSTGRYSSLIQNYARQKIKTIGK
ncbi:PQQ-binding-like beta-propeller repeat protein [Treponema pedis]|uniref:PQQ-binding-like beta-propeller repeat protein n=1 Tax=Treponema pedis TaxID=409322 RepID=UPI000414969C|nr:PQQ-binding-like beta-propeller repeat protein [Treponema pedis]